MPVSLIVIVVSICGAVGGFVNAFLTGSVHLPRQIADTYRPGWMGNVAIGAIAAFILWCLFDPSSSAAVISDGTARAEGVLSVADVAASIAVGIGAARALARGGKKQPLVTCR